MQSTHDSIAFVECGVYGDDEFSGIIITIWQRTDHIRHGLHRRRKCQIVRSLRDRV